MAALEEKISYCPFGCTPETLDEHGYCRHLVGFTNDGEKMDVVHRVLIDEVDEEGNKTGGQVDSGKRKVLGGRKVQKVKSGDKLVNPTFTQIVDGLTKMANRWVSSRVYRADAPEQKKAG